MNYQKCTFCTCLKSCGLAKIRLAAKLRAAWPRSLQQGSFQQDSGFNRCTSLIVFFQSWWLMLMFDYFNDKEHLFGTLLFFPSSPHSSFSLSFQLFFLVHNLHPSTCFCDQTGNLDVFFHVSILRPCTSWAASRIAAHGLLSSMMVHRSRFFHLNGM